MRSRSASSVALLKIPPGRMSVEAVSCRMIFSMN
jgi:hypothetical protein